ncbi:MAG: NUDIX domain-containing protein [Bacteroidota bacterium]
MDELVDILDEHGNYTGETAMKSKAHQLGLFHPTIHVWCFSKKGQVLLQQRGANKSTYPLKWDVSVAGHIGAGESPDTAAFREVQEEIGVTIKVSKLENIGIFKTEKKHSERIWDREFTHTFLYVLDEKTTLTKQVSEVEALEWVSLEDFEQMAANEDKRFVPNSIERYRQVIQEIKSRL